MAGGQLCPFSEQTGRWAGGWGCLEHFTGLGGRGWSWIMVCGCRRSSSCQLHLNRVVVADCQGLGEGKRRGGVMQGFGEPQAPCHAGRAAVIALPDPFACGGRCCFPNPETLNTQGSSFVTSHGEMPRCGLPASHLGVLCQLWVAEDRL